MLRYVHQDSVRRPSCSTVRDAHIHMQAIYHDHVSALGIAIALNRCMYVYMTIDNIYLHSVGIYYFDAWRMQRHYICCAHVQPKFSPYNSTNPTPARAESLKHPVFWLPPPPLFPSLASCCHFLHSTAVAAHIIACCGADYQPHICIFASWYHPSP